MRTLMFLTIITLMTMAVAKSEDTIDVKLKNYIVKEWNDIKEFQKAGWEEGKEQNAENWSKIKSFLGIE